MMAKKIIIGLFLSILTCGFFSCSLERDKSGDLGGMWHLVAIDTLSSGGSLDLSEKRIFWSIQGVFLQVDDIDDNIEPIIFHYEHSAETLILSNPLFNDRVKGDPKVTDLELLKPMGISELNEKYFVEVLDGGKMMLKSNTLRLKFRKY